MSRYARLRLGARPPSIAVSSATTAQHGREVAHLLLGLVGLLLMFYMEHLSVLTIEQCKALVTELRV